MLDTVHILVTVVTIGVLSLSHSCLAACYFPVELQGEFVMQSTAVAAHQVQYSHVSINSDAIPIWGQCHRRIGNHVILMDSFGVEDCIRCFLLNLRSRNVLQVHTEGLAKCYTTEEAAEATCPQQGSQADASREILLYKMKDLLGDPIPLEYCPFTGRFTYTYNVNDGSENKVECPSSVSEVHSCPSASGINLQFRRCSFDDHEITFQCLGDWEGPGSQRYLALLDTRSDADNRPRYRCALYHEDPGTGVMSMAFSSDSTCRSDLHSSVSGFETLHLSPVSPPRLPQPVQSSSCHFPSWMQGRWQHLDIAGNSIVYRDHVAFKTYSLRCVGSEVGSAADRFLVFGRTQCGEEIYSCIWMKQRSFNVLEFQLGLHSSSSFNSTLCSDSNFEVKKWITQGRVERIKESPCPIPGEYTGEIPDVKGLCAKLWSHCNTSETMHYTVTDCGSQQVYEERQYRCLGQWEEAGLVYTYTQRKDFAAYECFVGKIMSDKQIYIREAGETCERLIDPLENGMELTRQGPCYQTPVTTSEKQAVTPRMTQSPVQRYSKQPLPEPTKPWKPITGRPQPSNGSPNTHLSFATLLAILPILVLKSYTVLIPR